MKTEDLKGAGLSDEQILFVMKERGLELETQKIKKEEHDSLKVQLAEANKAIAEFKTLDIDGIKEAAAQYKEKAEKAEQDAATRIADMQFNTMVGAAITGARGKNTKAVMALLDMEALKASKNQEADIKEALDKSQQEHGYLFEQTPPPLYATGTGTGALNTKYTPEVNHIRSAAGLKQE